MDTRVEKKKHKNWTTSFRNLIDDHKMKLMGNIQFSNDI